MRGTVAYVSGDNLGSQEFGGFKIGSEAYFKCRECMGSAGDLVTKVRKLPVLIYIYIYSMYDIYHYAYQCAPS